MVGRAGGRATMLTSGRKCHIDWLVSRVSPIKCSLVVSGGKG